jgi:hypothetical protein
MTLSENTTSKKTAGNIGQVVEHLPCVPLEEPGSELKTKNKLKKKNRLNAKYRIRTPGSREEWTLERDKGSFKNRQQNRQKK